MNFIQPFLKILNFILPAEEIKKDQIKRLMESRIIFNKKKFTIHFLPYQNMLVNKALTSLKFRNNTPVAKFLGEIIYENLPEILSDLKISDDFNDPLLITIPISKKRFKKRGYNQTDLIIKNFMKMGGNNFCSWEKNNLIKIKETAPQTTIHSRTERLKNPIGSFKLKNSDKLKNKNIILFDDVYTTGSTINEAKKIIKKAKTKKILIMTIAH